MKSKDIAGRIFKGFCDKQIAAELKISLPTTTLTVTLLMLVVIASPLLAKTTYYIANYGNWKSSSSWDIGSYREAVCCPSGYVCSPHSCPPAGGFLTRAHLITWENAVFGTDNALLRL